MIATTSMKTLTRTLVLTMTALCSTQSFAALDAVAAKALARQDSCLRCHAVAKKKEGPSLQAIAYKYKNDASALDTLVAHITTGEMIKLSNGREVAHKIAKAKSDEDIRNLIAWILQQ